jgi:leader peptidase (prepilin peptidase)/N-methyltransferase
MILDFPWQFLLAIFILGAVIGSFLNVCIYRIPEGQSIVSPPSACPRCGQRIRWYDNIPILSYLLLRGRCRSCGVAISWRYPLVEGLNGLLFVLLLLRFGLTPLLPVMLLLGAALVVITFIDLDHQIIPDRISLTGIPIGFIASLLTGQPGWLSSLIGILAGGGSLLVIATLYEKFSGKEAMGGGDVKLLAMLGAFLGWPSVPFIIFIGSLGGSLVGVPAMLLQKKGGDVRIPFGPFLAFAALLYIFAGDEIIRWYFSLGGMREV